MKRPFAAIVLLCIMLLPEAAYPGKNDIVIQRGTEILVKIMDRLKSNNAQVGQTIRFLVERGARNDDGFVLIPDGAIAYGKVTKVAKAGYFGAGGKIGITIDSVEAYNGTSVQLSGNQENEGDNVTAFGGGIFRGTNAVIEAGTVFVAYVTHTTVLEERPDEDDIPAQQAAPARQTAPAKTAAPTQRAVPVKIVKQTTPPKPAVQVQQTAQAKPAAPVQAAAPVSLPEPVKQTAPVKQDKGYDFLLVNNSGSTFRNIWLSASGKPNWTDREKIKLPNRTLKDGESIEVKLPNQETVSYLSKRKNRYCDFRVELPNGQFRQWLKIDFENVYKIEINKKDGIFNLERFLP